MRILINNMAISLIFMLLLACAQTQPVAQAADKNALVTESVAGGIYVHRGEHLDIDTGYTGDISNVSFVVGDKGVAVIDSGGSIKVGQRLRAAIRKVTDKPILFVINTHVHPDHIFGNAAFIPKDSIETKPQFVGHEKLDKAMQTRKESYDKLNIKYLGDDAKGTEIVLPTLLVKTVQILDLGDRQLTITAHPNAHTNTDVTVMDSKTETLFTGDLLFIERTPVVEGDIKGLINELESLKKVSFKQVVPGHGPVQKNNADGIVAMNNALRYLTVLSTDIRATIKVGKSMNDAMESAAASEKGKWALFDIANRRNVNNIFPALEWE